MINTFKTSAIIAFLAAIAFLTTACGPEIPVNSITLKQTADIPVGGSETLRAEITPVDATNQKVTWGSNNDAVAKVTASGVVSGVAAGDAVITVTTDDGGKTANCIVKVTASDDGSLGAVLLISDAQAYTFENNIYSAFNGSVRGLNHVSFWNADGEIEYLPFGDVFNGTNVVTLASGKLSLRLGAPKAFALASVSAAFSADLTISSRSAKFFEFDEIGTNDEEHKVRSEVIYLYVDRDVKISGTDTGNSSIYGLNLKTGWNSVILTETKSGGVSMSTYKTGKPGGEKWIYYNDEDVVEPVINQTPKASDYDITLLSQAYDGYPKMVQIKPKTGKSPGVIIIYYNGSINPPSAEGSYAVTFDVLETDGWNAATGLVAGTLSITKNIVSVTGVTVDIKDLTLTVGGTETLYAKVEPSNATNRNLKWVSNNTPVATVSSTGRVDAERVGIATIVVSTEDGGHTANCNVTVTAAPGLSVSITGTPKILETLTADVKNYEGAISYEWYKDSVKIPDHDKKTHKIDFDDLGRTFIVKITNGGKTIESEPVIVPVVVYTVEIINYNTYLSANLKYENDGYKIPDSFICSWYRNDVIIPGETKTQYTLQAADKGKAITIVLKDKEKTITSAPYNHPFSGDPVPENLDSYLATKPPNNAATPHNVALKVTKPADFTSIGNALRQDTDKYVKLDLSDSTTVTSIPNSAFSNCSNLTSITLPDSVTSIGSSAFYYCTSLSSIELPDSVTSIGQSAFNSCTSLSSIELPDSVASIGNEAFSNCTSLSSISIPDSVNSIGSQAFYFCSNLATLTIPDGVTSIEMGAFAMCMSLISIELPDSVTSIGMNAFYGCFSLDSITIPDDVTNIGSQAFYNCNSLAGIVIPNGVTSIGSSAFENCSSLSSISIPNSVTSIGDSAFYNCTSLGSVTIGSGVTSIGGYAFGGCTGLTAINVDASNSMYSSDSGVLYNKSKTTLIIYPIGKTGTSFTIPSGVTSIRDLAFYGCENLSSVTIPNSVNSIGEHVFRNCDNLNSVTFDGNIPKNDFDYYAFYGQGDLRDVFYEEDDDEGTPGTYTRTSGGDTWTIQ